ncbi:MAG: hypothetical protein EXR69_03835 [Myxococcales bacterium]|nr:hypothetical protein [Myxococcales bacterium]
MTAVGRLAVGLTCIALWIRLGGPAATGLLQQASRERAGPPAVADVRARLALLPNDARSTPTVGLLLAALHDHDATDEAEGQWSRTIAAALSAEQRALACDLADLDAPTPPPPFEAPSLDGDLVGLVEALMATYGYAEVPPSGAPSKDLWPGTDRRTRARGILALVHRRDFDDRTAHVILAVSLTFLDTQLDRASNLAQVAKLLPIAMGETRARGPLTR